MVWNLSDQGWVHAHAKLIKKIIERNWVQAEFLSSSALKIFMYFLMRVAGRKNRQYSRVLIKVRMIGGGKNSSLNVKVYKQRFIFLNYTRTRQLQHWKWNKSFNLLNAVPLIKYL